eukprot:scaffold842_cov357-Prasinococcus_capsulatus_cf.AAC.9
MMYWPRWDRTSRAPSTCRLYHSLRTYGTPCTARGVLSEKPAAGPHPLRWQPRACWRAFGKRSTPADTAEQRRAAQGRAEPSRAAPGRAGYPRGVWLAAARLECGRATRAAPSDLVLQVDVDQRRERREARAPAAAPAAAASG